MACLIAALVVGLLLSACPRRARADSPTQTGPRLRAPAKQGACSRSVSDSPGKTGQKLKWLPYRPATVPGKPSKWRSVGKARLAQYTAPAPAMPSEKGAIDPFDDPFEDSQQRLQPPRPLPASPRRGPGSANPRPTFAGSMVEMAADGPNQQAEPPAPPDQTVEAGPAEGPPDTPALSEQPEEEEQENICDLAEFKPLNQISWDISVEGRTPDQCPVTTDKVTDPKSRGWAPVTLRWKASALCHKPVYFDDVHLERYGHSSGPFLQPLISGGRFFLTVPVLPYKMGLKPPNECVYALGQYRPGSCAPYMVDPVPLSVRAGLAQAGAWTGMAFLVP